jgi:sugar transferase (PEP-CTERM system associated)
MAGDALLIVASIWIAVAIRLEPVNVVTFYPGATFFVVSCYIISFYIFGLYNLKGGITNTVFLSQYIIALCIGTFLVALAFYGSLHWKFGRGIVLIDLFFVSVFTFLWRLFLKRTVYTGQTRRRVLIAGAGASGKAIYEALADAGGHEVLGFVDDNKAITGAKVGGCPVAGTSEDVSRLVSELGIDEIMVAITHDKKKELVSALLESRLRGVHVRDMQAVYENITGKLPVGHLSEGWLAYSEMTGVGAGMYKVKIKPIMSFIGALILMLVSFPVSLAAAAAIKLESGGAVFFIQRRVGLDGKEFNLIKFRSMVKDSEKNGAVWAEKNDPRVTRVGRIMRKLRIDELPQLWNILRGEMSLVGPRPERPEFVKELGKTIPFYSIRHLVRPGITGWAQVNFKYGASKEDALEKLQYDLYYVKNLSFLLDLHIILQTIRVVIFGEGAR